MNNKTQSQFTDLDRWFFSEGDKLSKGQVVPADYDDRPKLRRWLSQTTLFGLTAPRRD